MATKPKAQSRPAHPNFARLSLKDYSSWANELLVPMADIGSLLQLLARCHLVEKQSSAGVEALTPTTVLSQWGTIDPAKVYIAGYNREAKEFLAMHSATYELLPKEEQKYGQMAIDPEEFRENYRKSTTPTITE